LHSNQERQVQKQISEAAIKEELHILYKLKGTPDFANADAGMFERELLIASKIGLLDNTVREDILKQFDFLFEQLQKSNIPITQNIRARLFEYAVLSDNLGNQATLALLKMRGRGETPIDRRYLERFYKHCIAADNFEGIAHIVNYCQANDLDIGSWDIGRFRSALDYYLNVEFNISKVLVFSKFYTYYYRCRLNRTKGMDSEAAARVAFGDSDDLVLMGELFEYLVSQVGSQVLVDPQTKEEGLWNLIDLFSHASFFTAA